jgi:hypothetical protein
MMPVPLAPVLAAGVLIVIAFTLVMLFVMTVMMPTLVVIPTSRRKHVALADQQVPRGEGERAESPTDEEVLLLITRQRHQLFRAFCAVRVAAS